MDQHILATALRLNERAWSDWTISSYRTPFSKLTVRNLSCSRLPIGSDKVVHTGYEFDPRLGLNESASVTPAILRSSALDDVVARAFRDLRSSMKKKLTYQR